MIALLQRVAEAAVTVKDKDSGADRVTGRIGRGTLALVGVDRRGVPVPGATAARTVTYTGTDPDPEGSVVLHEIHPSPGDPALQFVELRNTDASRAFDLGGWRLNGVGYDFPAGSLLPAGGYLVLVRDPFAFTTVYPDAPIFAAFDGTLDPDGETLTLFRPGPGAGEETVVDRVRYETVPPWPVPVPGSSLQLVDATRDNSRVGNWRSTTDAPASPPQSVVAIDHVWKYSQSGDRGTAWRAPGYNDASWPSGAALLYVETAGLPAPKNTELSLGERTYYFRTTFTYSGSAAGARRVSS